MSTVAEILEIEDGHRVVGATEDEIANAERRIGLRVPDEVRAFLRWSNGWNGWLADSPLIPAGTAALVESNDTEHFQKLYPGYLALGGNGGLETYAIRLADGDMPGLVVAIDRNSSDPDDTWPIAATLADALERIRVQPDGPWDR